MFFKKKRGCDELYAIRLERAILNAEKEAHEKIKEMWEKVQKERRESYEKISEIKAEIVRYENMKLVAKDNYNDELVHKNQIIAAKDEELKRLERVIASIMDGRPYGIPSRD